MGNASLDDFRADDPPTEDAEASASDSRTPDDRSDDPPDHPDAEDEDAIEPVEATYAWSSDGGPCAACGDVTDRRWRGTAGLVCPACKDW